MKTLTLTLLLSTLALQSVLADDMVMRFQLFQATIQTVAKGGASPTPRLFKIDTATGRTWEFRSYFVDGEIKEGWEEKENLFPKQTVLSPDLQELRDCIGVLQWCEAHPTGGSWKDGDLTRYLDQAGVAEMKARATKRFEAVHKRLKATPETTAPAKP